MNLDINSPSAEGVDFFAIAIKDQGIVVSRSADDISREFYGLV